MAVTLDHLVVAAGSLEEGAEYVGDLLGVALSPGGKHPQMGTHNRLLRLGARRYLEVLALDPEAPPPQHPRWFGLEEPWVQARLRERPCLLHWVARTEDIHASVAASPVALGEVREAYRGHLHWQISLPADGKLREGGLVPSLIQWGAAHPTDSLPPSGCELLELVGFHPHPEAVRAVLVGLGAEPELSLEPGPEPRLEARIRTPSGIRVLR